jgi:hypothetical protein
VTLGSWFKLSTGFPDHPKIAGLSDAAFRLHVTAMARTAGALGDGWVPDALPRGIPTRTRKRVVEELETARLWEPAPGGWHIHGWTEEQRTSADIERIREQNRERSRRFRNASRNGERDALRDALVTEPEEKRRDREVPSRLLVNEGPEPTRDDDEVLERIARARATRLGRSASPRWVSTVVEDLRPRTARVRELVAVGWSPEMIDVDLDAPPARRTALDGTVDASLARMNRNQCDQCGGSGMIEDRGFAEPCPSCRTGTSRR